VIRRPIDHLPLFFKGAAMGVADTVPGVSGGTVAFITGIYEELIESLAQIGPARLMALRESGVRGVWSEINGNFLLAVFSGLLIALFSVAELMNWLITHHQLLLWAFFFGLILASIPLILGRVKAWQHSYLIWLGIGIGIGMGVTLLGSGQTPNALWMVFLAGLIAISAMVLPGISGSFLLLIMGQYEFMVSAVVERDLLSVGAFALGAVVGLLSIARVLSRLFRNYHDATVVVLTGFMIGSLNALWPWQISADQVSTSGVRVSPAYFESVTGQAAQPAGVMIACAMGVVLVALFARLDKLKRTSG
jgi:putative membrane protein